jgi:chromosome segregation ATPase
MDTELKDALKELFSEQLGPINQRLGNLESKLGNLESKLVNLETDFSEFRTDMNGFREEFNEFKQDTQANFAVLKGGQEGLRAELTDKFNELNKAIRNLDSDIDLTYMKTAQTEREVNRLKSRIG